MTITITQPEATVAIRAATSETDIPDPVATTIRYLWAATVVLIDEYAPDAPNDIQNAAAIRLLGWLYDSDPADPLVGRAMQLSGAAAILAPYRVHRAGAFGATTSPIPTPGGTGAGLPPLPGPGTWILVNDGGTVKWVQFPLPE